jgi:hypothetical protein
MLAFTMSAGVLVLAAPAAPAAGCLDLVGIFYDSPGDDDNSNASLNAEYVTVKNDCAVDKKLGGWSITDEDGTVFTFPKLKLKPKKSVNVHSGIGQGSKTDQYYQKTNYVWNNGEDTATLKNKSGTPVGRCAYDSDDPGPSVIC